MWCNLEKKKIREGHRRVATKRLNEANRLLDEIEKGEASDRLHLAQMY